MAASIKLAETISHPLLNSIPPSGPSLIPHFEPAYVDYYNNYSVGRLATHQVPIEDFRANPNAYLTTYGRALVEQGNLKITEQKCPVSGGEITIRIFEPDVEKYGDWMKPVYVNFHGGGWVFGGLQTDFEFCKRVAHEVGAVVFDVDYRLAPEFRFPIPVNDCWEALNWIRDAKQSEFNLDLDRLAIGGVSAGGHLAAVVAHMCRDASIPLAFQLLAVPVCDLHIFAPDGTSLPSQPYASYRDLANTQPLPLERMIYFHRHFLGNPRPKELDVDWRVSPMHAKSFKGLAKALVVTAEMDLLKDEGVVYGGKLRDAGVAVQEVQITSAPHTFMQMDGILEGGKEYNRVTVKALHEALGKKIVYR
ncbi:related to esterase [Rhynchosporium agropyri]|uniref:Related to esterase n=1 Tax=Rhynchosporium agropyri TaxID=914238 RepID=A0A1E1KFT1_9HELO|nr:related to esterase [Rhynchosporium agropyri]